ncbi:MAG: hypothetical protein Q8O25_09740 [Sulfurisoma sp.]|nr:hypothetical protein [Sulfurisoma sp.]
MLDTLVERLKNAIEDGELLTVAYSGGHHPGVKRRILPIRIVEHLLYARSSVSMAIKTYHLDGISVVSEDYPAPWLDEASSIRQRATRIDNPTQYFASWVYQVDKVLWPALGVSLREYVDKEKSAVLRKSLEARGVDSGGKRLPTAMFMAYAVGNPPVFDFHEGDIFFSKQPGHLPIQVVAKRKFIEVHQVDNQPNGHRNAYQLIDSELAEWLRKGSVPRHARIDAAQSYSDVLRFCIRSS